MHALAHGLLAGLILTLLTFQPSSACEHYEKTTGAEMDDADIRAGKNAAKAARAAGWPEQLLALAIALSMAESKAGQEPFGDLDRMTDVWGPSVGMTHIRTERAQTGTGGPRDIERVRDPKENFKAAAELMSGLDFSSGGRTFYEPGGLERWSTIKNRSYQQYLPFAEQILRRLNRGEG